MVVEVQAGCPDPLEVDFWIRFYDFLVYGVDVSDFAVFGADEGVLTVAAQDQEIYESRPDLSVVALEGFVREAKLLQMAIP